MGVDSYLELFTTAYGWAISNMIFSLLVDTGLVFFPLLVTVIAVWAKAYEHGVENGGHLWAVRKLEVDLYLALFVMSMCFVPTPLSSIDKVHLTFQPDGTLVTPTPAVVTGAASGSTYDRAFGDTGTASVPTPLWWYAVMSLSSGINGAVRASVSGKALGLRHAEQLAKMATIENPALRSEAQAFRVQCFVVAHAKYHDPQTDPSPTIDAVRGNPLYGEDDTEWIGSHGFQDDPAYYASIRALQPVAGFDMDPTGDDADAPPGATGYSMPNCKRWWATPGVGLRARLMDMGGTYLKKSADYAFGVNKAIGDAASAGLFHPIEAITTAVTAGPLGSAPGSDYFKDQILKQALYRSQSNYVQTDQVLGGANSSRWSVPELLSGLGIADKSLEASFSYYPIVQSLTMAQPFVLMTIYMFLPFIVLFSGFQINFMIHGALAIFTAKFWAAMWAIAKVIDERLIAAMYGDGTTLLREYLTNGFDGGAKRMVLNVLTLFLFIGLPLIWSGMMAWVGFRVGSAVDGVIKTAHKSGADAGVSAKKATFKAAKVVGSAVSSRMGK